MRRKKRGVLMAVNNIPMMNADIVTGVSLCLLFVVFFNGWGAFAGWMNSWQSLVVLPERLTMGFGTLLLAHICFNIPYVILSVGPSCGRWTATSSMRRRIWAARGCRPSGVW